MILSIRDYVAFQAIPIQRLGELQVTHVLSDESEVVQARGDPRVIVAEHAAIDLQRAFISGLCELPLLISRVNFGQIVESRGHVGSWRRALFQKHQRALEQFLCIAEISPLKPEPAELPQCAADFDAAGAKCALRKAQSVLQRRLRTR